MRPSLLLLLLSPRFLRDDERIEYYHLISMKHVGDTLNLKILRDGKVRVFFLFWGVGGP